MSTVAGVIVQKLIDAGVDTVFGLPGGENIFVLDAIRENGLRFVLVKNESSAVYMAAAYARVTGQIGAVLTTLGPGALNAAAGIGHAFLDRSPVIVLTAKMWDSLLPGHTHQVLDQSAIISPMTKASFTLSPDNVHDTMKHALRLTQIGCPGPVHVQVSKQVCQQEADPPRMRLISNTLDSRFELRANLAELELAQQALKNAKRPVLLVGLGLEPSRPYTELKHLAESLSAPVITTPKGKGALPADHPLAAGAIGLTRTDPAYEILAEADLVLGIGFDVVELVLPWDQTQAINLIWLAPWANVDPVLPAIAELVGTMGPIMNMLAGGATNVCSDWGAGRVAKFKEKWAAKTLPVPKPKRARPQDILQGLRQATPDDILLTADVGSHKILASLAWPTRAPNRFFLSNGLSCMGYGVPAAIAASLALNQPTVAMTGDGGFGMIVGELNLIHELNTPVIVVIMNDGALDLIRSAQTRSERETFGTEFTNPNFEKIAQAYDLPFSRVHSAEECKTAVSEAVAANKPLIVEAVIDPKSYPTSP